PRVVADLGAASISLYSVVAAIVMGATSLYRELEQKTLFPILARPIRRAEYLVGKFAGTLLTLATFIALDAGSVLCILACYGGRSPFAVLGTVFAIAFGGGVLAWRIPPFRTFGPIAASALGLSLGIMLASGVPDDRRVVLASSLLAFLEIMIVC